jgi:hypothetical protein
MKALERLGHQRGVHYFDQTYANVRDQKRLRFDFRLEIEGQIIILEYDGKFHLKAIQNGQHDTSTNSTQEHGETRQDQRQVLREERHSTPTDSILGEREHR